MKALQASPVRAEEVIQRAKSLGCDAIAWSIGPGAEAAAAAARAAGFRAEGWLQVARDPEAAAAHPEWMHCPQHFEWLRRFPDYASSHPALVAPYIGLNTVAAHEHALHRAVASIQGAPWARRIWLADIQGPPMGCGCGNPCCRSWDNAPGPKLASTPYDRPEILFPLEFYVALADMLPDRELVPVLCPECERFIDLDGLWDPDGPAGTDLCQGIPCGDICTLQYFPKLLAGFRQQALAPALLLLTGAFGKRSLAQHGGGPWSVQAHRHYGRELTAVVEPEEAGLFETFLAVTDAPQDCWPAPLPSGYVAESPPIMCGYCPPGR